MNYMCGKRLVHVLKEVINRLEVFGEIEIDKDTREKLMKISASTIDRLALVKNFVSGHRIFC